jgi:hypothetical protein
MKRYLPSALVLALGFTSAMGAWAQTPPSDTTPPPSSSSPAETPPANGAEPSAASSPHQREATGKAAHDQMMKDCIARQQADNQGTTAAQAKKTCKAQMKAQSKSHESQPQQ